MPLIKVLKAARDDNFSPQTRIFAGIALRGSPYEGNNSLKAGMGINFILNTIRGWGRGVHLAPRGPRPRKL